MTMTMTMTMTLTIMTIFNWARKWTDDGKASPQYGRIIDDDNENKDDNENNNDNDNIHMGEEVD